MDDSRFKAIDEETRVQTFDNFLPEILQREREAQVKAAQARAEAEKKNKRGFMEIIRELSKNGQIHAKIHWKEALPLFNEAEEYIFLDTHLGKNAARDMFDDFVSFELEKDFREDKKVSEHSTKNNLTLPNMKLDGTNLFSLLNSSFGMQSKTWTITSGLVSRWSSLLNISCSSIQRPVTTTPS